MQRVLIAFLIALMSTSAHGDITVRGQLKSAQAELLASDPTGKDGRFYFNTATDSFKWYDLTGTTWRVGVDTTSSQVVTGKDIDGGTASNTSRLTVPKAAKATLDGLTRKAATVMYATDESKLYVDNGTSLTAVGAGSSGEKNYVTSPSTYTAIANNVGWTTGGTSAATVATTTTGANLPREATTASGLSIAGGTANSGFVAHCWTIDDADKSRKLKAAWDQKPAAGYATGDFDILVSSFATAGCGGAETALYDNNGSNVGTDIPNYEGLFAISFDTTTAEHYGIKFMRRAGTSTLVVSDVTVGPGVRSTGAVVGPWVSVTPVIGNFSNSTDVTLSGSLSHLRYKRVGDGLRVQGFYQFGGAGSSGSSFSWNWSSLGLTGVTASTSRLDVPIIAYRNAASEGPLAVMGHFSGTAMELYMSGQLGTVKGNQINSGASNEIAEIGFDFITPIAEWAGAGTVNMLQDETLLEMRDYTPTLAGGTTASLNSGKWRRVGDSMEIYWRGVFTATGTAAQFTVSLPTGHTVDTSKIATNTVSGIAGAGNYYNGTTVQYATVYADSTTTLSFIKPGTSSAVIGSDILNTYQLGFRVSIPITEWRGKSVGAVGFAHATATNAGLYKPGTVAGMTSGATIAAGNVGEKLTFTVRAVSCTSNNAWYAGAAGALTTLTPGVWMVFGQFVPANPTATLDSAYAAISTDSNNDGNNLYGTTAIVTGTGTTNIQGSIVSMVPAVMSVSVNTPIYAKAYYEDQSGKSTSISGFAVRIH